jgi:signal transduction histidine kinase
MIEAARTGQSSHGIELGPLGTFTLRVVCPWQINGEVAGYIEIGKEIEHIMHDLRSILGVELIVAIHKKYLVHKDWASGMEMLGRESRWDQFDTSVVVSQTIKDLPENLGDYLSEENHEPMETITGLKFNMNGKHYQGGFVPFYDVSMVEIGEIVILYDVTEKIAHSRKSIILISIICVVVGVVLFVLFYIILGRVEDELDKHRKHLHEMVEERTVELTKANEDLQTLSAHLQSVRENERTIIAREIHDELGQILTGLQINFSNMTMELPQTEKTKTMSELIDNSIQTVQRISEDLRPSLLDKLGILPALEWHAEEFQTHMGIKCSVMSNTEDLVLDKDRSTAVFRIFQETLTNVARHANATIVKTDLIKENGSLILKITDDGKGITEKEIFSPKSFGIIGMRERTHFVNGELKINSVRGEGTTVTVSMPLQ